MKLEDLKIQLSKNGVVASTALTHLLKLKNLPNHYKIVKENQYRGLIQKENSPYKMFKELIQNHPSLLSTIALSQNFDITYEQFIENIDDLAAHLFKDIKVDKGENISICAESSIEGLIAFFAMNKVGAVNARVFNGAKEKKMKDSINNFGSKLIFTDEDNLDVLTNIVEQTEIKHVIIMGGCEVDKLNQFKTAHQNIKIELLDTALLAGKKHSEISYPAVYEDELASILYTSGSSGEPKPISLSNRVYTNMVDIVCNSAEIKKCDGEKVVGVVSHEYPYAAINSTVMVLLMGKTLILPKENQKGGLDFNTLYNQHPDKIQAIPNFYKMVEEAVETDVLSPEQLKSVGCNVSGGETYLREEKLHLLKFLSNTIKTSPLLIDGFGFGELGSATALKFGLGNYFMLMNGIEAKAIDPETKEDLPIDKEGILCFSSPTMADNYYNNEEATKKAFVTDSVGKKWFISDTYGTVHGKLRRLIKLGGRIREYFITGDGHGNFVKVYAGNVENVLAASGYVKDCVVVPSGSEAMPTPVAYISAFDNCNLSDDALIDLLMSQCSSLETFSQPTEIIIEEEIKRTNAKKKDYTYYKNKQLQKIKKSI